MILKFTVMTLLCSLVLCSEADSNTTHPLLDKFDSNNDGMIFYTEAPKALQNDFCQYDVNQDGYLDKSELESIK